LCIAQNEGVAACSAWPNSIFCRILRISAANRPPSSNLRPMSGTNVEPVTIKVDQAHSVSGLLCVPARARACYLLAHGAGAGMNHPFLQAVAAELAERAIATLRYQFPYMERRARRPDPPRLAHATVRAAASQTLRLVPALPLVAGGKSFGGRMTSQAQAASPLPGVRGLIFLGFPLHPARRPSDERGQHLRDVHVPMLFLQGAHDELADADLLASVVDCLSDRASLQLFAHADHSFHVPARSGRTDVEVRREMLDRLAAWIDRLTEENGRPHAP
jgi:predicted alpha/beta-hydrolase family hydrolase